MYISTHESTAPILENLTGCPLWLEMMEKLENEPFSEFGWNSWESIGCSSDLAGITGILI